MYFWVSLGSQHILVGVLWANERGYLKENKTKPRKQGGQQLRNDWQLSLLFSLVCTHPSILKLEMRLAWVGKG